MKKRLLFLIPIIVVTFILITIIALSLPWGLLYGGYLLQDVPKPSVEYGEFPFKLVYEIDGERHTIEDTLIIRYNGTVYNAESFDRSIRWTRLYKSTLDINNQNPDYSNDVYRIALCKNVYFELGSSEYYMGLPETDSKLAEPGELFYYPSLDSVYDKELYEKYGIKIIEKYISPPITEQSD